VTLSYTEDSTEHTFLIPIQRLAPLNPHHPSLG